MLSMLSNAFTAMSPARLQRKYVALGALLSLLTLVLPQHSMSAEGEKSMVFPVDTAHKASVMFLDNSRNVYVPSKRTVRIVATSYNSEPAQTDSTPDITAFGTKARDGVVAANFLPKGTQVRFPDIYGSKVFVVEDRMNPRYQHRVDIWHEDKEFSKQFGVRSLRMEVL